MSRSDVNESPKPLSLRGFVERTGGSVNQPLAEDITTLDEAKSRWCDLVALMPDDTTWEVAE